jgi:hypothetical protein
MRDYNFKMGDMTWTEITCVRIGKFDFPLMLAQV